MQLLLNVRGHSISSLVEMEADLLDEDDGCCGDWTQAVIDSHF